MWGHPIQRCGQAKGCTKPMDFRNFLVHCNFYTSFIHHCKKNNLWLNEQIKSASQNRFWKFSNICALSLYTHTHTHKFIFKNLPLWITTGGDRLPVSTFTGDVPYNHYFCSSHVSNHQSSMMILGISQFIWRKSATSSKTSSALTSVLVLQIAVSPLSNVSDKKTTKLFVCFFSTAMCC